MHHRGYPNQYKQLIRLTSPQALPKFITIDISDSEAKLVNVTVEIHATCISIHRILSRAK
ncbi:hypothetical protein VCR6J2_410034 [Vibrio coralliirubri]|nr:hypothetical protein VCR1J2_200211 [Vibrio coralliirubri]CDT39912.1 hypothetical protein VCR6J2_410034 [Vibrio coralliirubri]CDT77017.1 hypothetical protein VCR8J2_190530 [Vibrio coralliirubri]